jgi:SAM-dependent methyltransferase
MAVAAAQNVRDERFARAIDREVSPLWHDRFARLLWRHLPRRTTEALALDVHCGPGHTTLELLHRLPPGSRVVALEPQESLRMLAKAKLAEFSQQVYVKQGELVDVTGMADETYDAVVANLVLSDAQDFSAALQELLRVTKPGGSVLVTLPMDGSWVEVEDLLREVLRGAELKDAARRLRHLGRMRPTGHEMVRTVTDLGIGPHNFVLEQERFNLLFRSGREFLFAPVVELGPLRTWKAIIGPHDAPQELFWRLKESIDAYFLDSVFSVSIVAGLLHLRKPAPGAAGAQAAVDTSGAHWGQFPELDALWQQVERRELEEEDLDLDIDMDSGPIQVGTDDEVAASASQMHMSAEDEAIFALLDHPARAAGNDSELDDLLDQVLEFAGGEEDAAASSAPSGEMIPEALLRVGPAAELETKPGDTLSRIRSLLPPPPEATPRPMPRPAPAETDPTLPRPRRAPPPPPPGKLRRKKP